MGGHEATCGPEGAGERAEGEAGPLAGAVDEVGLRGGGCVVGGGW